MGGPAGAYEQVPLPFARESDTSVAAARSVRDVAPFQRGRIYAALALARDGLTGDELETRLGLSHQTVGPRLWELRGQDRRRVLPELIVGHGTRLTRSGRPATVWYVIGKEPQEGTNAGTK
jgi:hypothetical protein